MECGSTHTLEKEREERKALLLDATRPSKSRRMLPERHSSAIAAGGVKNLLFGSVIRRGMEESVFEMDPASTLR